MSKPSELLISHLSFPNLYLPVDNTKTGVKIRQELAPIIMESLNSFSDSFLFKTETPFEIDEEYHCYVLYPNNSILSMEFYPIVAHADTEGNIWMSADIIADESSNLFIIWLDNNKNINTAWYSGDLTNGIDRVIELTGVKPLTIPDKEEFSGKIPYDPKDILQCSNKNINNMYFRCMSDEVLQMRFPLNNYTEGGVINKWHIGNIVRPQDTIERYCSEAIDLKVKELNYEYNYRQPPYELVFPNALYPSESSRLLAYNVAKTITNILNNNTDNPLVQFDYTLEFQDNVIRNKGYGKPYLIAYDDDKNAIGFDFLEAEENETCYYIPFNFRPADLTQEGIIFNKQTIMANTPISQISSRILAFVSPKEGTGYEFIQKSEPYLMKNKVFILPENYNTWETFFIDHIEDMCVKYATTVDGTMFTFMEIPKSILETSELTYEEFTHQHFIGRRLYSIDIPRSYTLSEEEAFSYIITKKIFSDIVEEIFGETGHKTPKQSDDIRTIILTGNETDIRDKAYEMLTSRIKGQDYAMKRLSEFISLHTQGHPDTILMAGPSGCGKTESIRMLKKIIPTSDIVTINAKTLGSGGSWKGNDINQSIGTLVKNKNDCIIVIDEFDKITLPQHSSTGDNVSADSQASFLKVVEDKEITYKGKRGEYVTETLSNCSFILVGAFVDLYRKKSQVIIGNGKNPGIIKEDLIAYGMIEELAGRISDVIEFAPMTEDVLKDIINGEGASVIAQLNEEFAARLQIEDETVNTIVQSAPYTHTGARDAVSETRHAVKHWVVNGRKDITFKQLYNEYLTEKQNKPIPLGAKCPTVSFDDIVGMQATVDELKRVALIAKDGETTDMPKGILLYGPPGTGKTMLAKAFANESGSSFIYKSPSEANSAEQIADVFKEAERYAPCTVFFDEIDAIGGKRGINPTLGNDALLELLQQMDGFGYKDGIFIIAATNRIDDLDPALRRSGRFDLKIAVNGWLNNNEKKALLKKCFGEQAKHLRLQPIVEKVAWMTPADITALCRQAIFHATTDGRDTVNMNDIDITIEKMLLEGTVTSGHITERDAEITAIHEAGHVVISCLVGKPPVMASVLPTSSGTNGYIQPYDGDKGHVTANDLLDKVSVLYAGRASEIIKYGEASTGASKDISDATETIQSYCLSYGFDESCGMLDYSVLGEGTYDKRFVFDRIQEISRQAMKRTKQLLEDNYDKVERIAKNLLEKGRLNKDEIISIMKGNKTNTPKPTRPNPKRPKPNNKGKIDEK